MILENHKSGYKMLSHQPHVFMSTLKSLLPRDTGTSKEPVLWAGCTVHEYLALQLQIIWMLTARVAGANH